MTCWAPDGCEAEGRGLLLHPSGMGCLPARGLGCPPLAPCSQALGVRVNLTPQCSGVGPKQMAARGTAQPLQPHEPVPHKKSLYTHTYTPTGAYESVCVCPPGSDSRGTLTRTDAHENVTPPIAPITVLPGADGSSSTSGSGCGGAGGARASLSISPEGRNPLLSFASLSLFGGRQEEGAAQAGLPC